MEKNKKKIGIIIIVILFIAVMLLFVWKYISKQTIHQETQISQELITAREFENYYIENIKFDVLQTEKGNQDEFNLEIKNTSETPSEEKWIEIIFLREDTSMVTHVPTKIQKLQPGESHEITITSSRDLKEAKNFTIQEIEEPEASIEIGE